MLFFLIGLSGVGKSTLGKQLARRMGYSFIDLDALIEMRNRMRISEIFSYGEPAFRIAESYALRSIDTSSNHIVATGGGVVLSEDNIEYMRTSGYVVLLERTCSEILKSLSLIHRPLLRDNPESLYRLYEERKELYEKAKHVKFSIDSGYFNIDEIVNHLEKIEFEYSDKVYNNLK